MQAQPAVAGDTGIRGAGTLPDEEDGVSAALRTALRGLPDETASFLLNLARYETPPAELEYPAKKHAGVLVLLHVDVQGELSVTLTTRSFNLRSHPGDVALPGGRFETEDASIEDTALREASEEIGLPLGEHLLHIVTLPAFTSRTLLAVIPSVYFLTKPELLDQLRPNPDEVDAIFDMPLRAFLNLPDDVDKAKSKRRTRSASSTQFTYSYDDHIWLEGKPYRVHVFDSPSIPRPVTGFTADVLISVALIAFYGFTAEEEAVEPGLPTSSRLGMVRRAEGQQTRTEIIRLAMSMGPGERGLRDQRSSAR